MYIEDKKKNIMSAEYQKCVSVDGVIILNNRTLVFRCSSAVRPLINRTLLIRCRSGFRTLNREVLGPVVQSVKKNRAKNIDESISLNDYYSSSELLVLVNYWKLQSIWPAPKDVTYVHLISPKDVTYVHLISPTSIYK